DDFKNPSDLGSGGSTYFNSASAGGNGGGLVRLTALSLALNGRVVANGTDGFYFGGAGGGVKLDVGTLSGQGSIEAKGGYQAGGGRIAVLYTTNSGLNLGNADAHGYYGGAGTVFLESSSQTDGDMLLDNRGFGPGSIPATPFAPTGTGTLTFRNLTLTGLASMMTPDDLVVSGTLRVDSGSTLTAKNMQLP